MPAERVAMRQVREVLRLKAAGISGNEIARRVGVAPSTVRLTLKRLAAAELSWPLPAELTDAALEARLFTAAGKKQGHRRRAEPDWAAGPPRAEAQARRAADPVGRVRDCREIGGHATMAAGGCGSWAAWKRCPKLAPNVPL